MRIVLEHIAIYTQDLERLRLFYEKYFNAKSNNIYQNQSGFSSYFLKFVTGARLEIMTHTDLSGSIASDKVPGIHHLAFSVGSKGDVEALTEF